MQQQKKNRFSEHSKKTSERELLRREDRNVESKNSRIESKKIKNNATATEREVAHGLGLHEDSKESKKERKNMFLKEYYIPNTKH
ncbi:hypothetical protein CSUI_008160, partial [Cystoisospora suis]